MNTKIFVLLSLLWVIWGAYKPIFDRDKAMEKILASADRLHQECEGANIVKEKEQERRLNAWVSHGGVGPIIRPFLEDCVQQRQIATYRLEALSRETPADTYQRVGYLRIATFCMMPPVACYFVILAGGRFVRWLTQGVR